MGNNTVVLAAYDDATLIQEGDSLMQLGKIEEAIIQYSTVMELSPKNKQAVGNRAFAFLQLDKYVQSLADHDRAIALDPTNYQHYSNRALVKWWLKDYQSAQCQSLPRFFIGVELVETVL